MLSGKGRFLADHAAGAEHVVFVRSSQAHARITIVKIPNQKTLNRVIGQ